MLVPPRDSDALATSIHQLLTDKKLQEQLSKRGRKSSRQFSWDRVASQVLSYYEHLATGRKIVEGTEN